MRGFPFSDDVETFLQAHRINFVVEQNRDAQLRSLLIMETGVEKTRLRSILHYNGMPIPASYVYDGVASVITPERPAAELVAAGRGWESRLHDVHAQSPRSRSRRCRRTRSA